MYSRLRGLLFRLPTEFSHALALNGLGWVQRLGGARWLAAPVAPQPVHLLGLTFPNPVGLAAGLDKNGDHIDALGDLGFGFLEVGTVTPRPQPGNPRPRLFRLPESEAIINRMGFNNRGVDYLLSRIRRSRFVREGGVLGVNIGKNRDTAATAAIDDYLACMRKVYGVASYITVNLSSPNTPGLRDLQFGEPLRLLLDRLKTEQQLLATQTDRYVPLLIKIAPDMAEGDVASVAAALLEFDIDGVIATNTTIAREAVAHCRFGNEAGGLSGAPLTTASNAVVAGLARHLGGRVPIIGVGGILSGADAAAKMAAGAALVQLYTGFIYRGPALIGESARAIAAMHLDATCADRAH